MRGFRYAGEKISYFIRPDLKGPVLASRLQKAFPKTFNERGTQSIVQKNLSISMYDRSPRQFFHHTDWDVNCPKDQKKIEDMEEFAQIWKEEVKEDVRGFPGLKLWAQKLFYAVGKLWLYGTIPFLYISTFIFGHDTA